jgi:hypothetical protein
VKKSNEKWRMCVDFTDLDKVCPKDSFPFPCIDALVDFTSGYKLLSFMDSFSGYNQILMHPEDREKTAFITGRGLYCYKVMLFGLKNARATYQRLVNKMFQSQIGRNMEVYVDDILVKSTESGDHVHDLHEAFETLKQYEMKLNPKSFWVTWSRTEEWRLIPRRSKPSWKCSLRRQRSNSRAAHKEVSSVESIHLSIH